MAKWLEGIIEPELVPVASWIIIGFIALIVIFVAYKIIRAMTSGAFLMRGRNRKARLAVMDAAAIDDKRRLVLVRRDDVEHLILIGGANDVVVEHDIRMVPKAARPYPAEAEPHPADEQAEQRAPAFVPQPIGRPPAAAPRATLPPRPAEPRIAAVSSPQRPLAQAPARPTPPQPAPYPVRPASAPATAAPSARPAPQPVAARPAEPRPIAPAPQPAASPRPAPAPHAAAISRPAAAPARNDSDLDEALLNELQDSLDLPPQAPARIEHSLEDEMTKLLGELSRHRK